VKAEGVLGSISSTHCFNLSGFGENTKLISLRLAIKMMRLHSDQQVLFDHRDANHKH